MKTRSPSKAPRGPSSPTQAAGHTAQVGPSHQGGLEGAQDLVGNAAMLDQIRSLGRGPTAAEGEEIELPYRSEMEDAFGEDLSSITATAGPQSAESNAVIGAEAFALVDRIVFGKETPDKGTVAHEVAHVVQQRRAGDQATMQPKASSSPSDKAELEAEAAASAVVSGQQVEVSQAPSASVAMLSSKTGVGVGAVGASAVETAVGDEGWGDMEGAGTFEADIGNCEAWGTSLSGVFGGAVDTIIPDDGDEGSVSLKATIPVATAAIADAQVGVELELKASRSDKVELEGSFGFLARGEAGVDKLAEIFIEAGLAGFVEAKGDSSAEAFELLRYRFWEMLIAVSPELSLALFDFGHTMDTIRGMNAGDEVTTGYEFYVETGLELGDDDLGGSGELGWKRTVGSSKGFDDDGTFFMDDFVEDQVSFEVNLGPVGLEIKITQKMVDDQLVETGATVEGSVEVPGAGLVSTLADVDFFLSAADAIKDMASTLSGSLSDERARTIGSLGDWIALTGGPEFTKEISNQLSAYEGLSNSVTWKLVMDLSSGSAGFSGSLALQREAEVEIDQELGIGEIEASASSLDTIAEYEFGQSGDVAEGESVWQSYASNTRAGFTGRLLDDAGSSSKGVSDVLTEGDAEGTVNRAEAATIAGRALGYDQSLPKDKVAYFSDVPEGEWYFDPAHASRRHAPVQGRPRGQPVQT